MITKKTVLILGAGASKPYGFPTGPELKNMIIDELSREFGPRIDPKQLWPFKSVNERDGFRVSLAESGKASIDLFLEHRNQRYLDIGKVLIARVLIPRERTARLYTRGTPKKAVSVDDDWYSYLLSNILSGWPWDGEEAPTSDTLPGQTNQLSVVTLNYDRSLEHYLHNSLQKGLGWSPEVVRKWLGPIRFIHPYGTLGKLPWQSNEPTEIRDYEPTRDQRAEQTAASQLRIISKERDESAAGFDHAYKVLQSAHRVIVLGFGFDVYNVQRLRFPEIKPREGIASAFGLNHNVKHQARFLLGENSWILGGPEEGSLEFLKRVYGSHMELLKGFIPTDDDDKPLFPLIRPRGVGPIGSVPKVKRTRFDP